MLTALLVQHGVKHVVVCPGSRNANIVHNLNECDDITCFPVTDERSAGFYALGLRTATNAPVAVCVTSGTALLNLMPAVAEATYQHQGIIVISADRPAAWIGQNDGQTMPQPNALGQFVARCVSLPEPNNEEEEWYCNRLINEALITAKSPECPSVHINVPIHDIKISEDAQKSSIVSHLEKQRMITACYNSIDDEYIDMIWERIKNAERPMIVVGQTKEKPCEFGNVQSACAVLTENTANFGCGTSLDTILSRVDGKEDMIPDFVLYMGGCLVSANTKKFLRKCKNTEFWEVSEDGKPHDTFKNLSRLFQGTTYDVIRKLSNKIKKEEKGTKNYHPFAKKWASYTLNEYEKLRRCDIQPLTSAGITRKIFIDAKKLKKCHIFCANSSAIRYGNMFADGYVHCNRGINGIEGCLSTAAGFSLATEGYVLCVIGDLAFFTDTNALWNNNLKGNLKILLLNNNGGSIFGNVKSINPKDNAYKFISGEHVTSARYICQAHNIQYREIRDAKDIDESCMWLTESNEERPKLLEVFIDPEDDIQTMRNINEKISSVENGDSACQ